MSLLGFTGGGRDRHTNRMTLSDMVIVTIIELRPLFTTRKWFVGANRLVLFQHKRNLVLRRHQLEFNIFWPFQRIFYVHHDTQIAIFSRTRTSKIQRTSPTQLSLQAYDTISPLLAPTLFLSQRGRYVTLNYYHAKGSKWFAASALDKDKVIIITTFVDPLRNPLHCCFLWNIAYS